jgi:spore germination protein YaaH
MNSYRIPFILLVMVSFLTTFLLPAIPASAFSLQELVGQAGTRSNSATASKAANFNILDTLLGSLLGKTATLPATSATTPSRMILSGGGLPSTEKKEVVGFYAEWYGTDTASYNDFKDHTDQIQTIAPLWATVHEDGTVSDSGGDDHQSVVNLAHQNQRAVYLLVNNATTGNTAVPIDTLLKNPDLRASAINNLEATIKKNNLDGVNIDFEMVPAADKDKLTTFMNELAARLKPQGYIISMDVFPKEDESNDASAAYDYAELSKYVDKIMLMTYDNHGAWSDAGPIAGISWDERCLKYALQFIPKNKLYLGIGGYGYDWSSKGAESLDYQAIANLAEKFESPILWDDKTESPHLSYKGADGVTHQVWFENGQSIGYKLDLMNKYDIAGIALWKLSEEDPAIWPVIKRKLSQ